MEYFIVENRFEYIEKKNQLHQKQVREIRATIQV